RTPRSRTAPPRAGARAAHPLGAPGGSVSRPASPGRAAIIAAVDEPPVVPEGNGQEEAGARRTDGERQGVLGGEGQSIPGRPAVRALEEAPLDAGVDGLVIGRVDGQRERAAAI